MQHVLNMIIIYWKKQWKQYFIDETMLVGFSG